MDEIIDYVMKTPDNTNPNVLRGMLNNSGGNLPPVTADDNGDVLTVVEGAWAKAAPSGGASVMLVHIDDATDTTLDKTWQEIHDAAPLVWIDTQYGVYLPFLGYYEESGYYQVLFRNLDDLRTVSYATDTASGYPVKETSGGGGEA